MMDGGGWWMGAGSLVFIVLVVLLLVRQFEDSRDRFAKSSAEDILVERFARGEIDEKEYRSRLDALDSGRRAPGNS
jgi:putative membrane protein